MQNVKLNVGDDAWLYNGRTNKKTLSAEFSKGKVVHIFRLDGMLFDMYVIQIDTHIDPIYEVRDGCSVSDAPDKPIGLWRK